MKSMIRVMIPVLVLAAVTAGIEHADARTADVPGPAADETLIYVLREGRFTGSGAKLWIAVNDQTLARVKNKRYAVVRVPAGRVTLNLATQGLVLGSIAIDDRAGETVYLKYRVGDRRVREVDAEEGAEFLRKAKATNPIDAPRPNNERIHALINIGTLRDAMVAAADRVVPDEEHAVITFYRKPDKYEMDLGLWSTTGFVGMLQANEGMDVRLKPGNHSFLAGYVGKTLMRAHLEAGKQYLAELVLGKMLLRVKIVARNEAKVAKVLKKLDWVRVEPNAITPRFVERGEILGEYVQELVARADRGQQDFTTVGR